jgi:deoxyribonuclease-4
MTQLALGAHIGAGGDDTAGAADPVGAAKARGADLVQIFLGDPQGWKAPVLAYPDGPDALRTAAQAAGVALYVHAPYVVNVATSNNKIRIPSRKILQQHVDAAAGIGAQAVIVHGGHVLAADDAQVGLDNWRKTFERLEVRVPVLIENTAGGDHAMARRLEAIARLWEALDGFDVGFCLDTCHAWAGGIDLADAVDRIKAVTGRIDLVHCNDSKDAFDSGRDRHDNLGAGSIDTDELLAVVAGAGAPVVVETPGGVEGQQADVAFLREHLPR